MVLFLGNSLHPPHASFHNAPPGPLSAGKGPQAPSFPGCDSRPSWRNLACHDARAVARGTTRTLLP